MPVDPSKFTIKYMTLNQFINISYKEYMEEFLVIFVVLILIILLFFFIKRQILICLRVRYGIELGGSLTTDIQLTEAEAKKYINRLAK